MCYSKHLDSKEAELQHLVDEQSVGALAIDCIGCIASILHRIHSFLCAAVQAISGHEQRSNKSAHNETNTFWSLCVDPSSTGARSESEQSYLCDFFQSTKWHSPLFNVSVAGPLHALSSRCQSFHSNWPSMHSPELSNRRSFVVLND